MSAARGTAHGIPPIVLDARIRRLHEVLDGIVDGERPAPAVSPDPWVIALDGFAASWALEHADVARLALRAADALPDDPADDPAAAVLALAVAALAVAGLGGQRGTFGSGWSGSVVDDPIARARALLGRLGDDDTARFARSALGEAALACARIDEAAGILGDGLTADDARLRLGAADRPHRYSGVLRVLASRTAAFHGRVDEALRLLDAPPAGPERVDLLVEAARCLALGNAAVAADVRAIAERIALRGHAVGDRIEVGTALLAAFGLVAIGDARRAASTALASCPDLGRQMAIDRAFVLELALVSAIEDGDADAIEAWAARVELLSADPIAAPTAERMRSRLALVHGEWASAITHADHAIALAHGDGRVIEEAEATIVASRARIAAGRPGEAGHRLAELVAERDAAGHRSVRRAAVGELRQAGRRLRPAVGAGVAALSAREREVLVLLAGGADNRAIAARLHLSTHTVRVHVSRVLAAVGAPSRFAFAVDSAAAVGGVDPDAVAALTPAQRQVVEALVTGASNGAIADRLGIAVRTVEKHLNAVMRQWGVTGRTGVVVVATGLDDRSRAADGRPPQPQP